MPQRRTSFWTGLLLAPLLVLMVGCADTGPKKEAENDAGFQPGPVGDVATAGEPRSGGQLRMVDYYEPAILDPLRLVVTGSSGGNPTMALYGTLTRYDHEAKEFVPYMAESLTPSDDLTTWKLQLRDGVTFSDGTPYDAEAVEKSINRFLELGGFTAAMIAKDLSEIRVDSPTLVVFEFDNPWATFDAMLATEVGMIPAPAAYAEEEFTPIGAGPFTFDSYKPSENLVLKANKDYWEGPPHLESVRFEWQPDDTAKAEALDAGQVDIAFLRDIKVVTDRLKTERGYATMLNGANALMINQREGRPGENPDVLQAIGHAVNREQLYNRVTGAETYAGGGLFDESSQWYAGSDEPAYDPERAKELVQKAKDSGFDGKVTFLGATGRVGEAQYVTLKGMLEAVGFELDAEFLPSSADRYQRLQVSHDFDIAWGSLGMPDEMVYLRLRGAVENSSTGYENLEMDPLLDELQVATDDEARQEIIARIETLWSQTLPMLRIGSAPVFTAWSAKVHGVEVTTEHMIMLQNAWLS